MKVENIPPDEMVKMTKSLHRIFNAGGCNPACHCCYGLIEIGGMFKLSTIREVLTQMKGSVNTSDSAFVKDRLSVIQHKKEAKDTDHISDTTKEVMLCEKCTPDLFHTKQLSTAKKDVEFRIKYEQSGGGCFRVNGKISKI